MKIIKKVKDWFHRRKIKGVKITGSIARFVSTCVKNLLIRRRDRGIPKKIRKAKLEILEATDFSVPEHRELRCELDPIIYALVQRVANLITVRTPIFLDDAGNELEELKEQWEKSYYNSLLNDVIQSTRTHGFIVLEPLAEGEIQDRTWLVHDSTDIMLIKYDKFNIVGYTVLPLVEPGTRSSIINVVEQYDLFPDEIIHFYIGKFKKNKEGVAAIKPIWNDCVRYCEMLDAMKEYDVRIGNGMMIVSVDKKTSKGEIKTLRANIAKTNTKNFVVIPNSLDGTPASIDWESSTNRINWGEDLAEILKVISGATGLNVRFFIGDPKGAQSAAKEDKIANYQTLDSIFQEYVPFIRMLLKKQEGGEELNDLVADIQWDSEGVLDEDDVEGFDESYENETEQVEENDKT